MSPDNRQHRGPHPSDGRLFHARQQGALRAAVRELSWLLTHGYSLKSALKLVGDRHGLTERQRLAVARAACSEQSLEERRARRLPVEAARGQHLIIDGFNLVITLEAALSGGLVILCRDDCLRDLSGVHGSYRSVEETERAVQMTGEALAHLGPASVRWLLDKPISNSGRLAQKVRDLAQEHAWPWTVEVVFNPDAEISASAETVAVTSDSSILDRAARWLNFNGYLIDKYLPQAWVVDLRS
ncbi:MAG TPA: DUF434 domain-containing protein [Pyrinomonadaceae bacterium]